MCTCCAGLFEPGAFVHVAAVFFELRAFVHVAAGLSTPRAHTHAQLITEQPHLLTSKVSLEPAHEYVVFAK